MAPPEQSRAPRSLADDLRSRTSGQITALLRLRPDLLQPWPADLGQLARRAADDASVLEAMQSLTTAELRVLEVFACLHEATTEAVSDKLPDDPDVIRDAVDSLWSRALLWGAMGVYRIVRAAQQAFGPYPCGLAAATGSPFDAEAAREWARSLDPTLRERLVWQDPVATGPGGPVVVRADKYVLPREVSLQLREGLFLPPAVRPSPGPAVEPAPGRSLWAPIAGVRYVLTDLGREPLPWHPARGVSRRAISDRATAMAVPVEELLGWLELAALAGLIGPEEGGLRPTAAAPGWLHAPVGRMWESLVAEWLVSERPLPDCSPEVLGCLTTASTPRTALHRAHVLAVWPHAARVDAESLQRTVSWWRPRMHEAAVQASSFLAEIELLGLVEAGVPTAALALLPERLPAAAEHVPEPQARALIVQPDLTVVAPLSVDSPTWRLLQDIAHVESWGPVTTHRIDPARIRQSVAGHDVQELLERLTGASRTPIPATVEHAVRDAGNAATVRVYRTTLVAAGPESAEVLAAIGLKQVRGFASDLPPDLLARRLAEAGISTATDAPATPGQPLDHARSAPVPDESAVSRLVEHLTGAQAVTAGSPPPLRPASPDTMGQVCQHAISNAERLWLSYSEGGQVRTDLVEPVELRSGRLTAWSFTAGRTVSVPLAQIAAHGRADD